MMNLLSKEYIRFVGKLAFAALLTSAIITWYCDRYYYDVEHAPVRMVIIKKTFIPRFAFVLSSLPLAISSHLKYGRKAFSLVPAETVSAMSAFAESEFLIVGAHGRNGRVKLDDGAWLSPDSVPQNPNLKLIYFGSCEFGALRELWQQRYPLSKLVGYDGLTTPIHGWLYLVVKAPFSLRT